MRHIRSYLNARAVAAGTAVALLGASAAMADVSSIAPASAGTTEVEQADAIASEEPMEPEEEAEPGDPGPPPYAPAHGFRAQQQGDADIVKPPGLLSPPPPEGAEDPDRPGPPDHAPAHGFRAKQDDGSEGEGDGEDHAGGPPFTPPGLKERPPSNAASPDRDGPPDHAPARGRSDRNGH